MSERVLRVSGGPVEVRANDAGLPALVGYAAVFNQASELLDDGQGVFREYVLPGAFTKTLADNDDVVALFNHSVDHVLGRRRSGTLKLREDSKGLRFEVVPPAAGWARDLVASMKRGDVSQCSFGFQPVRDRWSIGKLPDGRLVDERRLVEVRLFDVSIVTRPAYQSTSANVAAVQQS